MLETKTDAELTAADKELLAQYEGAGGLTPGGLAPGGLGTSSGEKEATAAGVLSEFYTPEQIIQKVWSLVDAYAPDAVTVLEPSAGTGRFATGRNQNRFTLHELDETSSRIARILHPEAHVISGAFQKQFFDASGRIFKKNYTPPKYDVVIGNPPYGIYSGAWKGLGEGKHHNRYEEYFIEKGLDSLKENGILAYVAPSGFLRSGKDSIKELLASKGTLIDAWRLPNGTFPTTDVGADIIVMKRVPSSPDMLSHDSFFIAHPDHILGEEKERTGRFGPETYVAIPAGMTLESVLEKIIPVSHVTEPTPEETLAKLVGEEKANQLIEELKKPEYSVEAIKQNLFNEKKHQKNEPSFTPSKGTLLSSQEFASLYGKEHEKREYPVWAATAWNGIIDTNKLDNASLDFLKSSGNYVQGKPGQWMHRILYASGNIYEKIDTLETDFSSGVIDESLYLKNRKILEEVRPQPMKLKDIHFSPMTTLAHEFIAAPSSDGEGRVFDANLREDFINWVTGCYEERTTALFYARRSFDPSVSPLSEEDFPPNVRWNDIIEYLDGEPVRAERTSNDEAKKAAAIAAEQKRVERRNTADKLFDRYLHEVLTPDTVQKLETEWNRRFNNTVNPDYSKLPLFVEGMSYYKGTASKDAEPFKLYDQQIRGISFLSNKGNGLLAYDVGVGKTAAGIVATVNQIQTTRAQRPLIVVPKSVYSKWYRDIRQLFPQITVNDLGNFSEEHLSKYRSGDHGLAIPENSLSLCTIEALQRISFTDRSISGPLFSDFSNLLGSDNDGTDRAGSNRARKQQEEKISEAIGRASQTKEGFVFWEHTGFDHLTVDEAHRFKNLYKVPRSKEKGSANEYAGLGQGSPSARALKLFGMTQLVQRENESRNVYLLTSTPFTNSPLEVYSMLSYMAREKLKEMHIYSLKEFVDEFAQMKSEWAVDTKGEVQVKQVMKNFRSLPALQNLLREYIDKVDGEEAGIIRPLKFTHVQKLEPTEVQKQILAAETERMLDKESSRNGGILVAMNNMRMAMLSPSLVRNAGYAFPVPSLDEFVESSPKLKLVCDTVAECWKKEPSGGQIIYMPRGVEESKLMIDYLVKQGVPEKIIGCINSSVSDTKKDKLTEGFNDRNHPLKILIGSETISEGVDLNGNSFALYNCMLGWNPTETVQVEGRPWRQGNEQGHVHIVYPLMNDSIDALMYQKHDEKSSRINALWSYKGDMLNVEDINPEELKFDLIKDPAKKADYIISRKTAELRTEQLIIAGKLKTIDGIIEQQKNHIDAIKNCDEKVRGFERMKRMYPRNASLYTSQIQMTHLERETAEKKLPVIRKKLKSMALETREKVATYILRLTERKRIVEDQIKAIEGDKESIIRQLKVEQLEQKVSSPSLTEDQASLVQSILGNLRPMKEVEREIRAARGELAVTETIKEKTHSATFDQDLLKLEKGELPQGFIFNLGKPGSILQKCGFPPDHNIELAASRLLLKAARHSYSPVDISGLDTALQSPIAVFRYGDAEKSQNVIVSLEKDGKNFLAGVFFEQKQRGTEVSDIRGIFNKDTHEWLNWIEQGKLIYGDKEKIQEMVNQQRINRAEVEYLNLDSIQTILDTFPPVKHIFTQEYPEYHSGERKAPHSHKKPTVLENGQLGLFDDQSLYHTNDRIKAIKTEAVGHEKSFIQDISGDTTIGKLYPAKDFAAVDVQETRVFSPESVLIRKNLSIHPSDMKEAVHGQYMKEMNHYPPMYEKNGLVHVPCVRMDDRDSPPVQGEFSCGELILTKRQMASLIDFSLKFEKFNLMTPREASRELENPGCIDGKLGFPRPVFAKRDIMSEDHNKLLASVFPGTTREQRQEKYTALYQSLEAEVMAMNREAGFIRT